MKIRRFLSHVLAVGTILNGALAVASEIGQEIADQVDVASYQHYLADELYTHLGDDRGAGGGADHHPARDFIRSTFESFGLQVEFHEFTAWGTPGYNVVATQVGTAYPDAQYIIGAHYDSVDNPGADDNASGVAGILEVARVLSQYETEHTIKYIAFDIEEWGLIGSGAYVDDHLDDDIRGMFSMDMIAWNGYARACEVWGRPASASLKTALVAALNEYGDGLDVHIMGSSYGSNHAPFEDAGFPACELIEAGHSANPCYHRACDSVDTADYIDYAYAADLARSVAGFLADNAVVVEPCFGDLDGDGEIGLGDLAILLAHYDTPSGATYEDGDLDGDSDVDLADLAALLAVYGTGCP